MISRYRELAGIPHLRALLGWSVLGRLHMTGVSIAITFLTVEWTGSYFSAGLVVGAVTLGQGIAGPLRGRAADRGSASRLLVLSGIPHTAGLLALAALPGTWWPIAPVIAVVTGLFMPPVGQIARAVCTRAVDRDKRDAVFSVEAIFQEFSYLVGPSLMAITAAVGGGRVALVLGAAISAVGVSGFAWAVHRSGHGLPAQESAQASHRAKTSILRSPGVVPLLGNATVMLGAFTVTDVAIISWAGERGTPALAGVMVTVLGIGSLVGGLTAGALKGEPSLARRAGLFTAGMIGIALVMPPLLDPSPWLLGGLLAITGLAVAPAIATGNAWLGDLVPEGRLAEAFGWQATAATAAGALASPLSGYLLDLSGPAVAVGAGSALSALGVLLAIRVGRAREVRPSAVVS
ncbi:MFS transporter [Allokutzneria sp. A3M-2-11 16]|uniref:MFS transporter n=1 Tax=Allokutzneria sp. A3M-2-11 16 TaxID=2962043 RepID=UPI0020B8F759|nr:MFS transporter [Allokutzneria sp. A3M-2-11 16]MCP3803830.1 MFS transporter [Allokutzneria sp. A3M-2-11 16]